METFFSLLERHVQVCHSLLCVGLDPQPADLPAPTAEAARDFCLRLVEATKRYAAAYKPNSAFFEQFGAAGWEALKQVVEAIAAASHRTGSVIPVILDAKRGDIASTAEAYARAAFQTLGAHALTVSPYLGQDSVAPFLADREKGVFLLCKTSNPGADDLQELELASGERLYEHVAQLAQTWNTQGNLGLVVGATQPQALARLRALAPTAWFLVPGVGAQGGDLEQALAAGLRPDGMGMLINISRGISRAPQWTQAAAEMRDAIEHGRYTVTQRRAPAPASPPPVALATLAQDLLASGCVRFGQFTLKSGVVSPIYLDLRRLASRPDILKRAARAYAEKLRGLTFDRLAGIPYAGLPIATAVALEMQRPLVYPRNEKKDYGTRALVEGGFEPGETVVAIDDVVSTGGSKIEAIQKLEEAGLKVCDVVILIERDAAARRLLADAGYRLHAVVTLPQLLAEWRAAGAITAEQFETVTAFLEKSA